MSSIAASADCRWIAIGKSFAPGVNADYDMQHPCFWDAEIWDLSQSRRALRFAYDDDRREALRVIISPMQQRVATWRLKSDDYEVSFFDLGKTTPCLRAT